MLLMLVAIARPAVLATSKVMGKFETLATGTGKARLLLRYPRQLQQEALTVLSAVTVLLVVETRHHGVKGGPMLVHGPRDASSSSDPSSNECPLQPSRTISGGPK